MKKLTAYVVAYTLYWIGDLVSRPMISLRIEWLHEPYCLLMERSIQAQNWGGISGPWSEPNEIE